MIEHIRRIGLFVFGLMIFLLSCSGGRAPLHEAAAGVLDLRDWNWNTQGPVALKGRWEFHWQKFIEPDSSASDLFVPVPGSWNDVEVDGNKIGGRGYASYRLRILLNRSHPELALRILHFDSSYRMFLNSKLISEAGRPSESEAGSAAARRPVVIALPPDTGELTFIIHVSNYQHRNGGFPRALVLGERSDVMHLRQQQTILDILLVGAILTIALYHLGHFTLRQKAMAPLHFGIFCVLIGIRTAVIGERVIVDFLGWDKYFLPLIRTEYVTFYLAVPVFLAYARSVFPSPFFPRWPVTLTAAVFGAGSIFVLLTPSYVFSHTINPFQGMTIIVGLYVLIGVAREVKKGTPGGRAFLGGFLILFVAVVNDVLYNRFVVESGFFSSLGLFLFILAQALLLSRLYTEAFTRVEELVVDLADSEKRYRHLVEDSGEIILSLDSSGTILTANKTIESVLGFSSRKIIGRAFPDLVYSRSASNTFMAKDIVEHHLREINKGAQEFVTNFKTTSGEPCELHVRLQRIELKAGHAIFANLSQKPTDLLARHCVEDQREYSIANSFSLADLLNHSITAGLDWRLSGDDQMMIRMALRELLVNAIEHGNLEITFEEKSAATQSGTLLELLNKRLVDPRFSSRRIHVRVVLKQDRVEYVIRDEGPGFDHAKMMSRAEGEGSDLFHGRGIALAKTFFDEIIYNEPGNQVRLIKNFGRPQ